MAVLSSNTLSSMSTVPSSWNKPPPELLGAKIAAMFPRTVERSSERVPVLKIPAPPSTLAKFDSIVLWVMSADPPEL